MRRRFGRPAPVFGIIGVAFLWLAPASSATGARWVLHRLEGQVLERYGTEYAVLEGAAWPHAGTGGEPPGSLLVVLDPDPRAAPGPGPSYLGYGLYVGRVRGIASNNVALPAFRAVDLFEMSGTRPGRSPGK